MNGYLWLLPSTPDILYNASDYSSRKASWDGKEEVLIPPGEVNAPIYLNEVRGSPGLG